LGAFVEDTFTWTVSNVPPEAEDQSIDVVEGSIVYNGQLVASDAVDNDPSLTFSVVGTPPTGFALNPLDGSYAFDPSSYDVGDDDTEVLLVNYQVSDSEGGTDTATLTINVLDSTDPVVSTPCVFEMPLAYTMSRLSDTSNETSLQEIDFDDGTVTLIGTPVPGENLRIEGLGYNNDANYFFTITDDDDFIKLDPATGLITQTLPLIQDPAANFDHTRSGMGMTYLDGCAYVAAENDAELFKIDLATGQVTFLGGLSNTGDTTDKLLALAYNPQDDFFYGVIRAGGGTSNIVKITGLQDDDLTNNVATLVNGEDGNPIVFPDRVQGLAHAGKGYLIAFEANPHGDTCDVNLINPDTGEVLFLPGVPSSLFRGGGPQSLATFVTFDEMSPAIQEDKSFFYNYTVDFSESLAGSDTHEVYIKIPSLSWIPTGSSLTTIDTQVSNPYPGILPDGVYVVIDETNDINAQGQATNTIQLFVPDTAATSETLTTHAISSLGGTSNITSDCADVSIDIVQVMPPIVLDLQGDGIDYTGTDVMFDANHDGVKEKIAWIGEHNGLLVYDKNDDNHVTADEISFVNYKEGAHTDLEGLQAFDTNHNNLLDSGDAQWSKFKVWEDKNHDGQVDEGELKTLDEMGIVSINLTSDNNPQDPAPGVHEYGRGSYTKGDGSQGVFADASLQYKAATQVEQKQSVSSNHHETGFKTSNPHHHITGEVFGTSNSVNVDHSLLNTLIDNPDVVS